MEEGGRLHGEAYPEEMVEFERKMVAMVVWGRAV